MCRSNKPKKEKSCDHVRADNSAELRIEKLDDQIVQTQIEIQSKKEEYFKIREANDEAIAPLREKW